MGDENISVENDITEQMFTPEEQIEQKAMEKFEQYKYEFECNTYLKHNNLPEEIKEVIKFDNLETLQKNVEILKKIFNKPISFSAVPGVSSVQNIQSTQEHSLRKAFGFK